MNKSPASLQCIPVCPAGLHALIARGDGRRGGRPSGREGGRVRMCEMRDVRCEMMTAGTRCTGCVLGRIDVDIDVDEDDSLMLREGRRMKGQQSFTIRFRRDKLAVIFSRIQIQPGCVGGPGPGSGCTSIHPAPAQLTLDMLASVSRNSLPRPASRHCRSIRFQMQEGIVCSPSLPPFRGCPHSYTAKPRSAQPVRSASRRRMGRHCGKKEGVC